MDSPAIVVDIEKVPPGAILARDVVSIGGQLLCAKGTAVSAAMLAALRRQGVRELPLLRVGGESTPEQEVLADPQTQARKLERLPQIFRSTQNSADGAHLFNLMRRYRGGDQ